MPSTGRVPESERSEVTLINTVSVGAERFSAPQGHPSSCRSSPGGRSLESASVTAIYQEVAGVEVYNLTGLEVDLSRVNHGDREARLTLQTHLEHQVTFCIERSGGPVGASG